MTTPLLTNSQPEANKTGMTESTSEQLSKNNENRDAVIKGEEPENEIQSPFPVFTK